MQITMPARKYYPEQYKIAVEGDYFAMAAEND